MQTKQMSESETRRIKVKQVSIKEGTNDKTGNWINTRITGEDGATFSSFSESASKLKDGDLIEVEVVVKDGFNNFTEWKRLENDTTTVPPVFQPSGNNKDVTTSEQWTEKQRIERISIEGQTCLKALTEALSMDVFEKEDYEELRSLLKKAFKVKLNAFIGLTRELKVDDVAPSNYETTRLKNLARTNTRVDKESIRGDTKELMEQMVFYNPGEFYSACYLHFGLDKSKVNAEVPGQDLSKPAGRLGAWATILATYGVKSEKDTAKTKNSTDPEDLFADK